MTQIQEPFGHFCAVRERKEKDGENSGSPVCIQQSGLQSQINSYKTK